MRKNNGRHPKRFWMPALLICIFMILGGLSSVAFAETWPSPSQDFDDLDSAAWYIAGTDYVIREGLMKGVGEKRFGPDEQITRGMVVTILYRAEGEPATSEAPFTDLTADWYKDAVGWAASEEIVKGTSETTFAPDDPVTREQMATFLYRYTKYKGAPISEPQIPADLFEDLDQISDFALDSMPWAIGEGLMKGVSEKKLEPKGTATRAQVAVLLQRFFSKEVPEKEEAIALYLGVKDYGKEEINKDTKDSFLYRFEIDGTERALKIKKEDGYPIQNVLKEGYRFIITLDGDTVTSAEELPGDDGASYEPPVSGTPGLKTVKNFLQTALEPAGTTLYIYGGGWDWQDEGSAIQTRTIGVSPDWVKFFNENDVNYTYKEEDNDPAKADPENSYYPYGGYNEYYYAGLDCSGYVGWVIYNLENTEDGNEGYVTFACDMAKMLEQMGYGRMTIEAQPYITPSTAAEAEGTALKAAALTASSDTATGALSGGAAVWKADIRPEDIRLKPGDVVSMGGHVWISLGTCSDGSTLLLHSTPSYSRKGQPGGGVQISAIGTSASCEAYQLADRYMSAYFPEWYSRYPVSLKNAADYFEFEDENTGIFSWTPGEDEDAIADPEGIQHMTPAEVLKELFEN